MSEKQELEVWYKKIEEYLDQHPDELYIFTSDLNIYHTKMKQINSVLLPTKRLHWTPNVCEQSVLATTSLPLDLSPNPPTSILQDPYFFMNQQ